MKKYLRQAQDVLFEIVSKFIYSLTEYLVKIEPCYICLEHTMYNNHSLIGKVV